MIEPQANGTLSFAVTHHDTYVVVDPLSRRLVHLATAPDIIKAALYEIPGRPEISFLLAWDGGSIKLAEKNPQRDTILLLRGACNSSGDIVSLREPTSTLLLSAKLRPDEVVPTAVNRKEWEGFSNRPAGKPSAILAERIAIIDRFIAEMARGPNAVVALLDRLHSDTSANANLISCLVGAALTMFSDASADAFCRLALGWPGEERAPAAWLGDIDPDAWFQDASTRLQSWLQNRTPTSSHRVPAGYDLLGQGLGHLSFQHVSPGSKFISNARRLVEPRKDLAILATARDEGLYLLEWIAHHRAIGADRIFIYTNNNTDGSDALLQALADAGIVTWFDNTGEVVTNINMQNKAYAHALSGLPDILDYRWVLTLDLDEILWLNPIWKDNLPALLRGKEMLNADAVSFQWLMHYTQRDLFWSEGTCASRYRHTRIHPLIKSAFRPNRYFSADAHHPFLRADTARISLTNDDAVQYGAGATNHPAFINGSSENGVICHFAFKSLEEFVWKYARGENDGHGVVLRKRFRYNSAAVITGYLQVVRDGVGERDDRLSPMIPQIEHDIAWMKTLPGVAEAYDAVVQNYQSQIGALVISSRDFVSSDPELSDEDKTAWRALIDRWQSQKNETSQHREGVAHLTP